MKNKINYKGISIFILSVVLLFSLAQIVLALDYVSISSTSTIQELGWGTSQTVSPGGLKGLISLTFNFGIAVAVVLTLIMIIWGGIQYMTTDAWSAKEQGKERIINSLWGLGIALAAWLILNTINPALTQFTGNTLLNNTSSGGLNNSSQSSQVNVPGFSDLYNSQTGTLTTVGSQAASQQIIINNSPVQSVSVPCANGLPPGLLGCTY